MLQIFHDLLLGGIRSSWDEKDTNEVKWLTRDQIDQAAQYIERINSVINVIVPSHPLKTRLEHFLGELRSLQGNHVDAIAHYQRALSMSDVTLEQNHPLRAFLLHEMAESVQHLGNDVDSAEILHRALTDTDSHVLRVVSLQNLAHVHEKQEDWAAAISCYQDIIAIPDLPPNSLEIVRAYYEMGDAFFFMVNTSEAMRSYECALDLLRRHHQENHPLLNDVRARMTIVQNLLSDIKLCFSDEQ